MKQYDIEDLVKVAKRDNNIIRPYLYVNPIQGKHIPCNPKDTIDLMKYMAGIIDSRYVGEKILVVGFAETATAIGAGVSMFSDCVKYCTQTTREDITDAQYMYFTESHSHAKEQSVVINNWNSVIFQMDRILFVEDEVTTGNTICKLIRCIKDKFENWNGKYSIISILNSMTENQMKELSEQGIECLYVKKIPYEYEVNSVDAYSYHKCDCVTYIDANLLSLSSSINNLRVLQNVDLYVKSVDRYVRNIIDSLEITEKYKTIDVVGTEEFMFPPLYLAYKLNQKYPYTEIRFHATTRSPISVSNDARYPLHNKYEISSLYEKGRKTYIYNLSKYDLGLICTDAEELNKKGLDELSMAVRNKGTEEIIFIGGASTSEK